MGGRHQFVEGVPGLLDALFRKRAHFEKNVVIPGGWIGHLGLFCVMMLTISTSRQAPMIPLIKVRFSRPCRKPRPAWTWWMPRTMTISIKTITATARLTGPDVG